MCRMKSHILGFRCQQPIDEIFTGLFIKKRGWHTNAQINEKCALIVEFSKNGSNKPNLPSNINIYLV